MFLEEKKLLLDRYYHACYEHALSFASWERNKDHDVGGSLDYFKKELDRSTHEMDELRDTIESLYELKGRKRSWDRKQVTTRIMHALWMMAEADAKDPKGKKKSHRQLEEYFASEGLKDDADWRRS